ncbi:MAG: phosphoserine phosphatase SerB [Zetaproteobacteria bacterium]|nr:phosphoserine phosphatase SerB [Pseudobdellovibrionaceae bacterium]
MKTENLWTIKSNFQPHGGLKELSKFEKKGSFYSANVLLSDIKGLSSLEELCQEFHQEGNFIGIKPYGFQPQAFFFDMDGTCIKEESLVEIAECAGAKNKVEKITEQAMAGKIDFSTSLRQRVKYLKGLDEKKLFEVSSKLKLEKGMDVFAKKCVSQNVPLYLISGGFYPLIDVVGKKVQCKSYVANRFEINSGYLTGELDGNIVDKEFKCQWMKDVCNKKGYDLSSVVAVGDGANDKAMLDAAGLAVGFKSKNVLSKSIQVYNGVGDHNLLNDFLTQDNLFN